MRVAMAVLFVCVGLLFAPPEAQTWAKTDAPPAALGDVLVAVVDDAARLRDAAPERFLISNRGGVKLLRADPVDGRVTVRATASGAYITVLGDETGAAVRDLLARLRADARLEERAGLIFVSPTARIDVGRRSPGAVVVIRRL